MDLRTLLTQAPFDAGQERALAAAARAGSHRARSELVRHGLRLVALRVVALGVPADRVDDALQDGAVALIEAVDRFDPDRGARLSTWAWPWITGAIRRSVRPARDVAPDLSDEPDLPDIDDLLTLTAALGELDATSRDVLSLRFALLDRSPVPLTRVEVAGRLGIGVDAVRSNEQRAMRHLRQRLARVGDRAPRRGADPP